jgi:hypothetical protein
MTEQAGDNTPRLGPTKPVRGNGSAHVQRWLRPHELRRCPVSGCPANIAFDVTCADCDCDTIPLWAE